MPSITNIQEIPNEEEKNVALLLDKMGFTFIESRYELKKETADKIIGEIDLIFLHDNYLFIIEVTKDAKNGSDKKIKFFSKWQDENNLNQIKERHDSPHRKIVRIFFDLSKKTKEDYSASADHVTENPMNKVVYYEDFEYFLSDAQKIEVWAKNGFLDWLDLEEEKTTIEIDAIQYYIDQVPVFCFVERVDHLLKSCYVSRRRKNNSDEGYQRSLDGTRLNKIQQNIEGKKGLSFPNSILIKMPKGNNILLPRDQCPKHVRLLFPTNYRSCKIIDGQHRLLGFSSLSLEKQQMYHLTVIALPEYSTENEVRTFIDINSKQRKMDNNLILHLKSSFQWDSNSKEFYERIAVIVSEELNKTFFKNRIYFGTANESRGGKIHLLTLVSALISSSQIKDSIDESVTTIKNILKSVTTHMPQGLSPSGFFGSNTGVRVLFRLVRIYFQGYEKNNVSVTPDEFIQDIGKIIEESKDIRNEIYYGGGGAVIASSKIINALKNKHPQKYNKLK